jgi:hypothetical protein
VVIAPVATSAQWSRPVLSEKSSFFESGDHLGAYRNVAPSRVTCRAGVLPSAPTTWSWYSPEASERYAIHLPSGDQAGSRSRAPVVRVRLRTSPFSAGTLNSSPRASTAARLAEGDRAKPPMWSATLRNSGRIAGLSSGTSTDRRVSFSVARSITYSQPPFSSTIASPPMAGHFTSYSLNVVTWRWVFRSRSYAHRLAVRPPRSEQ